MAAANQTSKKVVKKRRDIKRVDKGAVHIHSSFNTR
jgi:ribosomal protein S11